mgnify:CR=1 FL=1
MTNDRHMPPSRFEKRSDAVSLTIVVTHLVLVLAPLFIAARLGPSPWLPVLWVWLGLTMNGLLNLMHEAAHFHVFRPRWANDVLGRWVLGPLVLADFDGYRQRHWDHHRRLGEPDDPKVTYHVDIHGLHLPVLLLRCLTLIEAARKFRRQTDAHGEPAPGSSPAWIGRVVFAHAVLIGAVAAVAWWAHAPDGWRAMQAGVLAYGGVYLYGVASLTVFAASLRAIAEYQIGPDGAARVGRAALRNFACNPLTRLIFGAYGFGEHATHHQQPGIPYYRLGKVTRDLARQDPSYDPRFGYVRTLALLARRGAS